MTPCHAVKLTATGLPWSRWTAECMVGESAFLSPAETRPAAWHGPQRLGAAEIRTNHR